jgi:hypothetical protein
MELKKLVVYAKCQEAAEVEGEEEAFAYHGRRVRQSLDAIDQWADMANAAIALAEYQAISGYDPSVDSRAYTAERGRLWDAFIMARVKVKGASDEST